MKRFIVILLIVICQLSIVNSLWAQPHVEAAFRALVLEANEGQMPEERLMEGDSDSRFTLVMHQSFTLPTDKFKLITDMYKAMDDDSAMRTQYRLHDAFSAREWRLDIETPHFQLHERSEESVNNLMGGFFVPEKSPRPLLHGTQPTDTSLVRLYRYYVLSYQEDMEGNLTGSVERITFDADTQEPNIQQPSTPKYQALIDAITVFCADDKVIVRRNLSERRAAATGQWTHIYNTIGFNMPLDDEVRLLGPLWKAFLNEQPRAYRSLSKPAGQVASDVQIIYDEQGHTLGLGTQQQWNITYVYFNDEDFPQNRYVYALWYKPDVPRQRIVGELVKINTLRPEGGSVRWPFVQRTVPTYLWRMSVNPYDQHIVADQGVLSLPSYAASPDFARMQGILQDIEGLDMRPLRFMLDTLMQRRISEMDAYNVEVMDIGERYRESLQGLSGMLKLDITAEEYKRMTQQERMDFNEQARKAYQEEQDRVNTMYKEYLANISRRHPIEDLNIFRRDSMPSDVFRATFGVLTMAYQGDASERDAQVAERLRQMAEMAADEAPRSVRLGMYQKLDSIINLRHPNLPGNMLSPSRQALAEAVMALDVQPDKPQTTEPKNLKDLKPLNDGQASKSASSNHPMVHSEEAFKQKFDHYYRIAHTRLRQFKQQGQPLRNEALGAVRLLSDLCRYNSVYARPRIKKYISKLTHGLVPKVSYATPDMTDAFEQAKSMINEAVETLNFLDDYDKSIRNSSTKVSLPNGQTAILSQDKTTLTLPNGNSITAGKIKVNPFKGSVLGLPGAKMTVRQGKRIARRAERRLRRMVRRADRWME